MLSLIQADRMEIILVSLALRLNIGAAARAMANFSFRRLSSVAAFAKARMQAKSVLTP